MLGIYTFFFSVIFKSQWGNRPQSKTEFALVAFVGLILFNLFVECLNRAPQIIISNVNYVKKVVFPLEILPVVVVGSALFHLAISSAVWLVFRVFFLGVPPWTSVLFPFSVLPLVFYGLGIAWFLSSLGAYLRDVSQVVGVMTSALMFVSPIFFPSAAMTDGMRRVLRLNPLTPAIENAREALIFGHGFPLSGYAWFLGGGLLVAWAGFAWFQKTRGGFADVL